jgi:phosphoribosyl-ATP pyrophosphohydrolase
MSDPEVLRRLSETLLARRNADPESSYVARLLAGAPDAILRKIGEESTELVIAGMAGDKLPIVREAADLVFHVMVLLAHHGLTIGDVVQELHRREGISGLDEKRARGG